MIILKKKIQNLFRYKWFKLIESVNTAFYFKCVSGSFKCVKKFIKLEDSILLYKFVQIIFTNKFQILTLRVR